MKQFYRMNQRGCDAPDRSGVYRNLRTTIVTLGKLIELERDEEWKAACRVSHLTQNSASPGLISLWEDIRFQHKMARLDMQTEERVLGRKRDALEFTMHDFNLRRLAPVKPKRSPWRERERLARERPGWDGEPVMSERDEDLETDAFGNWIEFMAVDVHEVDRGIFISFRNANHDGSIPTGSPNPWDQPFNRIEFP